MENLKYHVKGISNGLNPSFNGIWSWRVEDVPVEPLEIERLNPSFNGIWSWRRTKSKRSNKLTWVLILLLMEYGHGEFF